MIGAGLSHDRLLSASARPRLLRQEFGRGVPFSFNNNTRLGNCGPSPGLQSSRAKGSDSQEPSRVWMGWPGCDEAAWPRPFLLCRQYACLYTDGQEQSLGDEQKRCLGLPVALTRPVAETGQFWDRMRGPSQPHGVRWSSRAEGVLPIGKRQTASGLGVILLRYGRASAVPTSPVCRVCPSSVPHGRG